jgi:LuxR family maltose regulon positive regulatory protein
MIPVDQQAGRYRYQKLFQQWLELELEPRRTGAAAVAAAHHRAADALARRGDTARAAEHALQADDPELAYVYLGRCGLELLDSGRHATLNQWYGRLPEAPDTDHATELALLRAWSGIVDGDLDTVDRMCARAADAFTAESMGERIRGRAGEIVLLTAYSLLLRGSIDVCREALTRAADDGVSPRAQATMTYLDAAAQYWLGAADAEIWLDARSTALSEHDPYVQLLDESFLGLIALDANDEREAARWIDAAFETATDHHLATFGYLATAHLGRGRAAAGRGDLDRADAECTRAIELAERRHDVPVACLARLALADVHHSAGDRARAREMVRVAAQDLDPIDAPGILGERLAVVERQLRLQQKPTTAHRFEEPVEELTDRELALLRLLPGELTQRELGAALHMWFNTVKSYNR